MGEFFMKITIKSYKAAVLRRSEDITRSLSKIYWLQSKKGYSAAKIKVDLLKLPEILWNVGMNALVKLYQIDGKIGDFWCKKISRHKN